MPEKPILIFPTAKRTERAKRRRDGRAIILPSAAQQRLRLETKFRTILSSFTHVQASITGLDPEQVIVLEVIGDVGDLARAAENVPGLEWLAEIDLGDVEPPDGFTLPDAPEKKLPLRLFALMTSQQAMTQLVGLWDDWCQHPDHRAVRGFGPFKDIFKHLRDVRLWGPRDRVLDTGVTAYWQDNLGRQVDPVRFQVELWCRKSDVGRGATFQRFSALVQRLGGQCVKHRTIPEIMYDGALVDIPRAQVEDAVRHITAEPYTELLRCGEVMFFRPMAQMASPISRDMGAPLVGPDLSARPLPADQPVVALLDGCPLENHLTLANRLTLDDPDDLASRYAVGQQQHGTGMASLMIHGDLSAPGDPLPRPVYVRPILSPVVDFQNRSSEMIPADQLPVDLIERAVRRIFEADGSEPAVAPSVRVINLSIGDASLQFVREISPLARLLDWLSWKYNVLFIVSAGNQAQDLELACTRAEFATKAPEEVRELAIRAILADQKNRRPFAPAEAINALTVGAIHADQSGNPATGPYRLDPFDHHRLPSPLATVSGGYRRSVKPEVLMEGGRQLYERPMPGSNGRARLAVRPSTIAPGQRVAAPGSRPAELDKTVFCCGTSNATALATRTAGMIYERLTSLANEPGGDRLGEEWMPVLLKTLLVHGASWGGAADLIEQALRANLDWRARASVKRRLLGYGEAEPARSVAGTEKRVLLVGWDLIAADEGHEYVLPLPPSLASVTYKRRLTVSLGWISPVNLRHRSYRQAALFLDLPARSLDESLGLGTAQVSRDDSARGTVQHMVFEGDDAVVFTDGAELIVKVNCRSDAGKLEGQVRYALAVTLEVADPIDIDIHTEILQRVRARARVAATGT